MIEEIKKAFYQVITQDKTCFLEEDEITDLLTYYSSDFCLMLLKYYPGATIMMHKNFRSCALMITGRVYTARGLADERHYFIADKEALNFIKMGLPKLSDEIFKCFSKNLFKDDCKDDVGVQLRKNS